MIDTATVTLTVAELARRMHDSDRWPVKKGEPPHTWDRCNDEHRQRYLDLAGRYLAQP